MRVAGSAVALALAGVIAWPGGSAAQAIIPDASMGTVVTPTTAIDYTVSGGRVSTNGSNLFHSFNQFNVPTLGRATFQGDAATANVLSRVTGGQLSTIDGVIDTRTFMPAANFFLINPSGVVFGANAMLDVGGAFRVSTADSIIFPDAVFSATPGPGDAVLSSLPPQAFGFLNGNPAPITLEGAQLFVDPGQTLSIVGGDVHLRSGVTADGIVNSAVLFAPGGMVQVVSAASAGTVDLNAPNLAAFSTLGTVSISEGSVISAGGNDFGVPGGTVVIRSGQLVLDTGAIVLTDTGDFAAANPGIDIDARDSMTVRNGALVQTISFGTENASSILIRAGSLAVSDGGVIESTSLAPSTAMSGAIDIQVGSADIASGGAIRTTSQLNSAGNITIAASGTVTLSGATSEIMSETVLTSDPTVFGGNISLTVSDLVLRDQARIRSGGPTGQAGQRVSINATNAVSISGLAGVLSQSFQQTAGIVDITTPRLAMDAGYITTSAHGVGGAGQILVNANTVGLANGAQIASSSQNNAIGLPAGCCPGGTITINAPGSLTISGTGPANGVGSLTFTGIPNSGVFSTTVGTGNAGQIVLSTPLLTLADGGRISVATVADGNAGTIVANVGTFGITGGARVDSSTTAAGAGGAINVNGTLAISGAGSGLFSTASSTGNAGAITTTGPSVTVASGGTIDSGTTGVGDGGEINVSAASQVEIANGGSIRADSLGSGLTGNITLAAGDRIMMDNGSISTRAVTSDGGNITLLAPNVIRLGNSQITTSVESGTGSGGNIFIDPQFVILQGSTITANAFGGPGGSITIIADNFLSDATSSVTASSALSTPGTVTIQSPENNLKEAIAQLPGNLVDASRLLRGACSARQTGAPSSFAVAGRGGVPADADGYLSSFSTTGAPLARAARQEQHDQGVVLAMASLDCAR